MKKKKRKKWWIWLLAVGLLLIGLARSLAANLGPSLREMAIMQANSLASDILAAAMEEIIAENAMQDKKLCDVFQG